MIPNNVRTIRITAAAGTNLARASSRDRSDPCGLSSPSTVLYNPKAFIAHAASLGQACAHCRRSSTAASRRSLASVSVPVARVVLSHPLDIFALVGHHPTNKLISHEPLPRRNSFPGKDMRPRQISRYYSLVRMAIPVPRVGYPCITAPFATFPSSCPEVLVRLACLIHAANVRSEPGSNPSKVLACPISLDPRSSTNQVLSEQQNSEEPCRRLVSQLKSLIYLSPLRHDSKNLLATTCIVTRKDCVTP